MNKKPSPIARAIASLLAVPVGIAALSEVRADDAFATTSANSVTIGGEEFSVDPRSGTLSYSFNFFKGNVNFGQTPFSLDLKYQASAGGSYVGAFTDSHSHSHPFGVSAYLPTPLPNTMTNYPDAVTGQAETNSDDSGAVWDLNLPVLYLNTSYVSNYYGKSSSPFNGDSQYANSSASLTLGDTTYQYTMPMEVYSDSVVTPTPWDAWTNGFAGAATPVYSKDADLLTLSTYTLGNGPAYTPPAGASLGILVQDKTGVRYYFQPAVLYGYNGPNVYRPSYSPNDNSTTPKEDQVFVYRIGQIAYPDGKSLNFTYTDDFTGNSQHQVSITDSNANPIAQVNLSANSATVSITNQSGQLPSQPQFNLSFSGYGDYRVTAITNNSNQRTISFDYAVFESVPYSWNNQTVLTQISNGYTSYTTNIGYQELNVHDTSYDAGCNQFYLGQVAVQSVTNLDNANNPVSQSSYDFGFGTAGSPTFALPQVSGQKTFTSGLSRWLDNVFYNNQDSSGCSTSSRLNPVNLGYGTTISTSYPDPNRGRTESITYDSFGRTTVDGVSTTVSGGRSVTLTTHTYQQSPSQLQSQGSFQALGMAFASPASTTSGQNLCSLNGTLIASTPACFINPTQSWVYDAAGNPTQETSILGQVTQYTYLPANQTSPSNERLAQTVKTFSIGNGGKSYVFENQNFQNVAVAPAGSPSISQTTLATANVETRYDSATGTTYNYRTDRTNYVTGQQNPILNGTASQRIQQDNTGVSDVSSVTTQNSASLSTYNGQPVLVVGSQQTGLTSTGGSASQNRGTAIINAMGYPMQTTDGLGRATTHTFDDYGRTLSTTTLAGTAYAQTTSFLYDTALSQTPAAINGQNPDPTLFSIAKTDPFGNITIQTFDARRRHTGTWLQLNSGSPQLQQIEGYLYNDATNTLSAAVQYGDGYRKLENYYYSPGTSLRLASVPNYGLAKGLIIDAVNGNTLEFSYQPATSSPTVIGKIYGPVKIAQTNTLSHLLLADALIDADAATAALAGFDLVNGAAGVGMVSLSGNVWVTARMVPLPLINLYKAIANLPQNALTPSATDNLLEMNVYGYDEWNRRISTKTYTFVNSGTTAATAKPLLSSRVTTLAYNNAQRTRTITYPEGQQKTEVYNLLNGMQSATLQASGNTTILGSVQHDGIGRAVAYQDSLNGSTTTVSFDAATGLPTEFTDAYGNQLLAGYDPVSFLLTQSTIVPANTTAPSIVVDRSYNTHLQTEQISDNLGNTYGWLYAASGLPQAETLRQSGSSATYQYSYDFDTFGDLFYVFDPFILHSNESMSGCMMGPDSAGVAGAYYINLDNYGRLSDIGAVDSQLIDRNFAYDQVTGLLNSDTLSGLAAPITCLVDQSGPANLITTYTRDDNLRLIGKSVALNSGGPTAQFSQFFDPSGHVTVRTRTDLAGNALSEQFGYSPTSLALTSYSNGGGSAMPYAYKPVSGGITAATYKYDLYHNIVQASLTGAAGSLNRTYGYTAAGNPFQLSAILEKSCQGTSCTSLSGAYTYDQAGNATKDAYGRSFAYDGRGLLASVTRADRAVETFTRDGLGRIVQRNAPWLAGPVTDYGRGARQQGNNWQVDYFGGTFAFSLQSNDQATATDAFLSIHGLGGDAVSSVDYARNGGIQVNSSTSHLPYGTATNLDNVALGYPLGIAQQAHYPDAAMGTADGADVGTGLEMMGGYRAYDPVVGRFLQMDSMSPFGAGGLNGYAYANNDPVNFWDPTGHAAETRAKIYGPLPPHANHSGFWQGFGAGMKNGMKEFFVEPYHWAKSYAEDLASGNMVGALRMGFDMAADALMSGQLGVLNPLAPVVFQEFVGTNPSAMFSGKSPFSGHLPAHGNAYQTGYGLGNTAGGYADQAGLAVAGEVMGKIIGAAGNAVLAVEESADAGVAADTHASSTTQIDPRATINGNRPASGESPPIRALSTSSYYTPRGSVTSYYTASASVRESVYFSALEVADEPAASISEAQAAAPDQTGGATVKPSGLKKGKDETYRDWGKRLKERWDKLAAPKTPQLEQLVLAKDWAQASFENFSEYTKLVETLSGAQARQIKKLGEYDFGGSWQDRQANFGGDCATSGQAGPNRGCAKP